MRLRTRTAGPGWTVGINFLVAVTGSVSDFYFCHNFLLASLSAGSTETPALTFTSGSTPVPFHSFFAKSIDRSRFVIPIRSDRQFDGRVLHPDEGQLPR